MSANGGLRVRLCGGDLTPDKRSDACPNELHDWPLPTGYTDASEVAHSRLYRKWANPKCPDCGLYGWRPGTINPRTDIRKPFSDLFRPETQ